MIDDLEEGLIDLCPFDKLRASVYVISFAVTSRRDEMLDDD
jgi:hypothetical protein